MGWQLGGNRKSLHRVPLHDQPSIRWHRTLPTERAKVPRWHHRLACKLLAKVPLWQGLNREFTAKILSHLHVGLILVGLTLEQRLSSKDYCKVLNYRCLQTRMTSCPGVLRHTRTFTWLEGGDIRRSGVTVENVGLRRRRALGRKEACSTRSDVLTSPGLKTEAFEDARGRWLIKKPAQSTEKECPLEGRDGPMIQGSRSLQPVTRHAMCIPHLRNYILMPGHRVFRDILERLLLIEVEVPARPSEDEDAFVGSIAFTSSVPDPLYIPICKDHTANTPASSGGHTCTAGSHTTKYPKSTPPKQESYNISSKVN
ncbi:hypothetical protein F5146DRAFT_1005519 [Armillaria mellea]|nr:hypothetical protein F5146DRAFT_1005519 [Armillaria mellea]